MALQGNSTDQNDDCIHPRTGQTQIDSLIADLSNDDGLKRVKARKLLVTMGDPAVESLKEALSNNNKWVRWEAAKALGQIGNAAATQTLIRALEDKMFDVRWLAAEGLINIGHDAVVPLLHELIQCPESTWLREGAHHVFHDIAQGDVKSLLLPVVAALEDIDAVIEVPIAAKRLIDTMTGAT